MAGTMDFEDSSLLEESKDVSPLKTPDILDNKNANESLFSMPGDVSNSRAEKAASFLSETSIEESKNAENPMQRLARRKTHVQDRTVPHITNLHED